MKSTVNTCYLPNIMSGSLALAGRQFKLRMVSYRTTLSISTVKQFNKNQYRYKNSFISSVISWRFILLLLSERDAAL